MQHDFAAAPDNPLLYERLRARIIDEPLLAHPVRALGVAAVVLDRARVRVNVATSVMVAPENRPRSGPLQERRLAEQYTARGMRPFLFDPESGIAVIDVTGGLAHRERHIGSFSGIMGYDGIGAQIMAALEDGAVRGIALDIHSAGGEVAGAFQLADRIASARRVKPMIAIADEMAFSAAYLLAAATGDVFLAAPTAQVGSVGVVMVHLSFQQQLADEGIAPTIIQAGAQKADGNPFQNLPDDVAERFQARIDSIYAEFVARVARWTGMTEAAVRDTEAGTFMGKDAVSIGLAKAVADPADVLEAFAQEIATPRRMPAA